MLRVWAVILLFSSMLSAQSASPAEPAEEQPTFMKVLAQHDLHDIEHESWNAYGQFTYISSWKPNFNARYTNANGSINSLLPIAARSFTGTATLYLGVRLWKGAEAYFVPEVISEVPFSQLKGPGRSHPEFRTAEGRGRDAADLSFARIRPPDNRAGRRASSRAVWTAAARNQL